jgi:hypothetical protein
MAWRIYLFILLGFWAVPAGAAETLLVTVEVGQGQSLTADEVRVAVALEVGDKVLRAAVPDPGASTDLLMIDVDQGKVGMVFRSPRGATRRRTFDLPATHEASLRLMGQTALALVKEAEADEAEAEGPARSGKPSRSAPSHPNPYFDEPWNNPFVITPPPLETTRPRANAEPPLPVRPLSLAVHGGFALVRGASLDDLGNLSHGATVARRLELEAQLSLRSLSLGMAIGVDSGLGQGEGGAFFVGTRRWWRRLRLEGTGGFGLWGNAGIFYPLDPAGAGSTPLKATVQGARWWLLARTNATVFYPLYPWLDFSFRVSLHLGLFDLKDSSLAGLLGLRANL